VAITLPANTPAGEGYLIVFVDALDAVAESNESNNTRAVAIRVQAVDNPPDTELTEAPDEGATVCSLPITLRWRGIDDQTPDGAAPILISYGQRAVVGVGERDRVGAERAA
jgi:hypothetical protein